MCILFTTAMNFSFKICVKFINYKDSLPMIMSIPYICDHGCATKTQVSPCFKTSCLPVYKVLKNWIAESIQYDKCLNARDFCTYISYDSWHVMNLYFMKLESKNKYCTQTCTIVLKIIHVRYLIVKRDRLVSLPFITYLHKSYICMYISHIVIHHMCRGSPPPLFLLSKYLVSFWRRWQ